MAPGYPRRRYSRTERLADSGDACGARRVAKAVANQLPECILGQLDATDEADVVDRVARRQHVFARTPPAAASTEHLDILIAAEGHHVRDRFSRGSHRELIAHAGLDQAKHGRVVDRSPLFIELDLDNLLANLRRSAVRAQQQPERHRQRDPRPDGAASEGFPDPPVEGVDAVLVAPQDPRQTVGLIEFEQDDLVAPSTKSCAE